MEKFMSVISESRPFAGIDEPSIRVLLMQMDAERKSYSAGDTILEAGQPGGDMGLILLGRAQVVRTDYWGSRTTLTTLSAGQTFSEEVACTECGLLSVSLAAGTDCEILFLKVKNLLSGMHVGVAEHMFLQNLLSYFAARNYAYMEKLSYLGQRTTRAKLLSYLSAEATKNSSNVFDVPLSRQQMADYLFVERSGLSMELCKMRDEGLLEFRMNHFELKR